MQAVILAGGKGTRLENYTDLIPKPLIQIDGKPVLEYQIDSLKKSGLTDIIISIGYLGDKIIDHFGDGGKFGVRISYLNEETPLGTGGVLYYLKELVKDPFILLFGDIMLNLDWHKFINFHHQKNGLGTFLVHPNSHPYDSDLLILDGEAKLIRILPKNQPRELYDNLVKSGVHIFTQEIFRYARPGKADLERDIIRKALEEGHSIYGYKTAEYVKDMGTLSRLEQVTKDVKNGLLEKKIASQPQKCIFLDRDGTINKYKGLLFKIEDLELEDGASTAIKMINQSEYLCIVITNQPVVARNLCTETELNHIHQKLQTLLGLDGAYVDDLYYCPHHPDQGYPEENKMYKIKCNCRKPAIGMIQAAQTKYNIDLQESYLIGDTTVDIQTGKNSGLKTVFVRTGEFEKEKKYEVTPDMVADNLLQAVSNIILKDAQS